MENFCVDEGLVLVCKCNIKYLFSVLSCFCW